jgi:hypothetical protein
VCEVVHDEVGPDRAGGLGLLEQLEVELLRVLGAPVELVGRGERPGHAQRQRVGDGLDDSVHEAG